MKKLLFVLCVFVLFISLLGANNSIIPVNTEEKAIPGESFGAGKGLSGTSTDEVIEVAPKPELIIIPKSDRIADPLASGGNPEEGITLSGVRALSDVLDSLSLPGTRNTGSEWNGRYLYIVSQGSTSSDSASILVFDPEDGSIVDSWKLPFTGYCMGIAFVNNAMYVSCWTDGTIKKINPTTHALIASYSAPGGNTVRGITSDGTNLYVGAASTVDSIYLTDTLINSINSWYIGSFCDWVVDLAYASRDNAIWLTDEDSDQIMKVDLSGPSAVELESFVAPTSFTPEGISFDGSDLWFNAFDYDMIIRIDGGYSHSRIALFQDREPWGYRSIKDILYDNGIPFKVFGTNDIGSADLSIYTKAIIAGYQYSEMGDTIAAYQSWWENWISNGGVLQISGATTTSETWEGLTLPGDFSCVNNSGTLQNLLEIASSWHPLVNQPYIIDDDSLDNWGASSHGYLTGLSDHYTVVQDTASRPVLAIKRLGDGGIIATQMTLEYAWYQGYSTILENVIKYWLYGVSTNVLFALADADQPWLKNALIWRDSLIGNIDYMDVSSYSPILEDLNMYDVVLTRSNYSYYDSIATGDTLATYVDAGGRVIVCTFCWCGPPYGLSGGIMDPVYNPFSGSHNHNLMASLGWNDATHPIMDGVTLLSEYYRDSLQVNSGADTVAKYDDGEYLLGYRLLPSDGIVVGFNLPVRDTLYGMFHWSGQMVRLTSNIINWSASYSGIEDVIEVREGLAILEMSSPIMTGNEWLSLSIDSPARVELRIINIAGIVVSSKSLNYTSAGVKKVEFDVSKVPSGAYFLSLKTREGNAIRKALVIK